MHMFLLTIVDAKTLSLHAKVKALNPLVSNRISILYKWPSGMLTNYFIALPSITNALLRIGVGRGLKRKLSYFFPKALPSFFILW